MTGDGEWCTMTVRTSTHIYTHILAHVLATPTIPDHARHVVKEKPMRRTHFYTFVARHARHQYAPRNLLCKGNSGDIIDKVLAAMVRESS